MSDSPTNLQSGKRPLEDPSSPSAPSELPDAKRLALGTEKTRTEVKAETDASTNEPTADSKDTQGDTIVSDAANDNVQAEAQPQPIQSTASQAERAGSSSEQPNQQDETHWIHIRAVISSQEAATVIGKAGENVSQIRRMSGAKCTVSDYSRGAFERILTVSGLQDAVAKGGSRIREIQEASGARLNASDACLPLSTERSLVIVGVADAVHIATYYVAVTLVEQLTDRFGGPAASAYATRSGGPAGAVPGGMQVVPYVPQPAGGQYGHPDQFKRHHPQQSRAASGAYGVPYMHGQPTPAPPAPYVGPQPTPARGAPTATPAPAGGNMPGQPLTQQIYIPNDMVGAIIGKGGAKINEIRHLSGSVIKINEPQENSNERLCNQMALYMLYTRLGESESVNHNRLREVFLTHIGFIPTESEKHRV
ncbi:hypothetical protein N7470_004355 [Penicillium chermesinum]|nr:hypothetical protein N7470_004355 [Penicillium chermesinum]